MKRKEVHIVGVIIPSRWDDDGNPLAVAVASADEIVELTGDAETISTLIGLLHSRIEISGTERMSKGKKTLVVSDYQLKKPVHRREHFLYEGEIK